MENRVPSQLRDVTDSHIPNHHSRRIRVVLRSQTLAPFTDNNMADDDVVDMDVADGDQADDDAVDQDDLEIHSSKVSGANDLPWVEK